MRREPFVAGQFYPARPDELAGMIRSFAPDPTPEPRAVLGGVAPHAGYVYSGRTAAAALSAMRIPQRVILLCPNHTGEGAPLALWPEGSWRTPLGETSVDEEMGELLRRNFPLLAADESAHLHEHAIEVLLPFLQLYAGPSAALRITPIVLGTRRTEVVLALGATLARVVSEHAPGALILASSDMNHYENDASTRRKDHLAIECMLAMDAPSLLQTTQKENITMCGVAPAAAMLEACRRLGAQQCKLDHYATSAEAFGDKRRCVGYAGLRVF